MKTKYVARLLLIFKAMSKEPRRRARALLILLVLVSLPVAAAPQREHLTPEEIDEAVVNIDDAHTHNQKSPLLRKALYKLSEASNRFLPQLVPLRAAAQSDPERELLEQAIEQAQQIVEAAKTHAINEDDAKEKSGKKGN